MKRKVYYMHTIDGRPGFYDGDQVVSIDTIKSSELCTSLRQLRSQQEKARKWRKEKFPNSKCFGYGYVRIVIEEDC